MATKVRLALGLTGLLLFAFTYSHQRHFRYYTPVSRLDVLHAIVEDGGLSIDRHHKNTGDKVPWGATSIPTSRLGR